MKYRTAFLLLSLFVCWFVQPLIAAEPLYVSLIRLIANPKDYDGKVVQVIGFVRLEFEGTAIYLHKDDYNHGISKNGLWIDETDDIRKKQADFDQKYVLLEGTFNAKQTGHMNLWSGSIQKISRFEVWSEKKGRTSLEVLSDEQTSYTKTSKINGIKLSVTRLNESIITCLTNGSNDDVYLHGKVSLFRIKVLDSMGNEMSLSDVGKRTFAKAPEEQEFDEENPGKDVYYSGWAETKPGLAAEKVYDLRQLFILKPGDYKVSVHVVYSRDQKTQSSLAVRDIPLKVVK